ncbi:MAG: ABC transporter ATP-binding protein/permease, partial [Dehalococcoidia bacterium]|nr:ABC transporter ATP-binding protein/permease [Dehalococcoidia bacterium]
SSALDADEDDVLGKVYDSKVIARLPKYLAPVKGWLALGASGMIIRTLGQLAPPYLIAIAIDNFIQTGNFGGLGIIALALIGIALLMWGGEYMSTIYLAYAGQSVLYRMRTEMFDHLHRLSLGFFDHNKVGKLMSRVQNDVNQLQEVLTQGILNILTSVLTLVGIIIVMITMNPRLALLTFTVVPVLGIIVFIWQKYARRAFIRVRQAIAVVNDQLQEGISGVRVIQSLSREDVNIEQFDDVNRAHLDANISAARLQAFMMPTVQILTAVAYALVIIFGGYQVMAGTMGVGFLVTFIIYIQRFFEPVIQLTMLYTQLQRAMASGARVFELLDVKPEIKDSPDAIELPPIKGEVKFNKLSFAYEPGVEVLHDIDLTVNPGETVAIVGRTGAGKSSLMNLLSRFYEANKGEIIIDGYSVDSVTQESLRRQIGIVPQDAFLFSGTIEDNIRYGNLEASHEEVIEAAKAAGVHDAITRMEKSYDTPVGERGGSLSAGQRQLVCLARAILANPPIMILDEATSNVDTNTERIMQKALRRVAKGRTCIIIAHRLSTITSADRIVALEQGKIVEMGTHRELLAKQGLYYQMFQTLSSAPELE